MTWNPQAMAFLHEVAKGNMPTNSRLFNIAGRHEANVETTQLGDISLVPSVVVLPDPGGIQLELVSTSTNDDGNPVGTGARTVDIHYLDTSGVEQVETVTMNGTTAATTTAVDIDCVQWIHTKTVGSGGVAAGNISLQGVGGGTVYEYIAVGGNQSLSARYRVPAAHKGYLVQWKASALKKRVTFYCRAECERSDRSLVSGVRLFQATSDLEAAPGPVEELGYVMVPALAQVVISGQADAAGGVASASFQILVVAD